ncbi:g3377 [Coccomyxa viridis]|uniref:G3377 protein n=1 Tax=Coccomyxa viridis TaxID=1274662 RepID=A0ABP1FMP2_9CHLO
MGSLRFPDAAQERRFVKHAGEHGLSVMRMHRVVDASLFYFSAKGATARYSVPRVASFISTGSRWASALQLLALATTLFAPRLIARHHELFKIMCQHVNFLIVVAMTWVITITRSRYQIVHACNVMFSAVNFLPGQVRVCVFVPIVALQSLIWICVGARSRSLNPEHAGAPLTTLWMWVQHIALTEFMGVVLTCCVGGVLEMHARQSFVRTHRLEDLDWQPGVLPRLMMLVLDHLRKVKSRLLDMLGARSQQQAKGDAGKQSYPAKGMEQQECKQLPGAGTVCESSESLSSPASSSCDSGSDADVSEAQKVCCGVQGMQAQACQKLLNKGKTLDSKCKQLACRVELLETEVGKDSLAAMAEQVRSRQLLQRIATLTQRVNAQRCVTAFLGSQEEALKAEVESLRKERKQLTTELGKAHALIEETAADRLEATELLSRAVHIMESMRDHMSTERKTMWQCILQMLHLQPDATPAQASASFARRMGKGSCADGGDLARFLQALAEESTLSHRASEVSSHSTLDSSNSSSSSQLRSQEGSQHPRSTGPTEVPAAAHTARQENADITDPQLSEMLDQISCNALPDPRSTGVWPAHGDSIHGSPVRLAEHPATADSHLGPEQRGDSIGCVGNLGSEVPGGDNRTLSEPTRHCSRPSDLLDVKHQQDAGWELNIDSQVKELYLSVLRRLNTGATAQTEWLSSAKSNLSGSVQEPCSSCKASAEKVAEVEAQHTGFQGAVVVALRSMMAQERSLREELGDLASELEANLPDEASSQGHRSSSCPAESSEQQFRSCRRKCITPNTLADDQLCSDPSASCCWQGLEEPDQDGQAARSVAQRLQELSEGSATSAQAASELTEMLFPVPSIREVNTALANGKCSQVEAQMDESLSWMASWLHAANSPPARSSAKEQTSAEALHGALSVIVSGLVDRAFATQTAYVHAAHSLSKQTQALTSLNAHLMSVRQNERRMLEMLMNNRARLLTHMAVLRTCSRIVLCHECHAPAAPDSLATSPAA